MSARLKTEAKAIDFADSRGPNPRKTKKGKEKKKTFFGAKKIYLKRRKQRIPVERNPKPQKHVRSQALRTRVYN